MIYRARRPGFPDEFWGSAEFARAAAGERATIEPVSWREARAELRAQRERRRARTVTVRFVLPRHYSTRAMRQLVQKLNGMEIGI